ncbi:hypothetical protein M9Y10_018591 [Tritrichomonas musculus]|uniref:DUF3447 domain-containing protein n=1 Tax=Tritrichomonas musculus TaxID=1915356 RepID=A0ABR2HNN6_9EUKA
MDVKVEVQKFLNEMKEFHEILLNHLDSEENNIECPQNLILLIDDSKICNDKLKFKSFLYLIVKIADNHHRSPNFIEKIIRIIKFFIENIKKNFTNDEIFFIFRSNKLILLFLIQEQIINFNSNIISIMRGNKYESEHYLQYFYPEVKPFLREEEIEALSMEIPNDFDERRKNGQNDKYLCELICKDNIEEFVSHVNRKNTFLNKTISPSIYETNSFLQNKKPLLIEYAAFFGSIQIIKYLVLNQVPLVPSMWLYAIHGANADLIHYLEENKIKPKDESYEECLIEAFKCNQNDIANYIRDNLMTNNVNDFKKFSVQNLRFYNFQFVYEDLCNNEKDFFDLCAADSFYLVSLFLNSKKVEINKVKILNLNVHKIPIKFFFEYNFKSFFLIKIQKLQKIIYTISNKFC